MCTGLINVYIASDHAGYDAKQKLLKTVFTDETITGSFGKYFITSDSGKQKQINFYNVGPELPGSVDYPIYAQKTCKNVLSYPTNLGILICGSGQGMAMAANKYPGIRCGLCRDPDDARMAVEHNFANMISIGARKTSDEEIREIVKTFLTSQRSSEERHQRRVQLFSELEDKIEYESS